MSGYQVMPRLSPDEYADLEVPAPGYALTGTCRSPFAVVKIEESDSHPGYFTVRVMNASAGYSVEPDRPVRIDEFGKEFITKFISQEINVADIEWSMEKRVEVSTPVASVYFISAPSTGLVKIGFSNSVESRFKSIQTMSPVPLTLLGSVPGGAELESELHKKFAAHRNHGEWFSVCDEISDYIKEVLK